MPVKGLLVKFVGPHQRTGQSPLSQKWSGGEIHRAPKAQGLFLLLVTGVRRSPLRFFLKNLSPSICVLMGGLCVRD